MHLPIAVRRFFAENFIKRMCAVMSYVPTPQQAREILEKYNKEPFHLAHGETVAGVMGVFARKYDPENVAFWPAVSNVPLLSRSQA